MSGHDTSRTSTQMVVEGTQVIVRSTRKLEGGRSVGDDTVLCALGEQMGLVYDAADGVAHRVGRADDMEGYAGRLRAGLSATLPAFLYDMGLPEVQSDIRVALFEATPESVQAVMDCWNTSAQSREFAQKFGQPEPSAPGMH